MLPLLFAGIAALTFINSSQAGPLQYRQQNSIQWVDCASNVPQLLQGQGLPKTLPSTLHCGRLDVPMDYAKPIAADNKITLGFSMYRPDKPRDLINFNPGGPGVEVASFAWQFALNLSEAVGFAGLEAYDFLAMDVRGSFSSNPLNCSIGNLTVPSSYPANEADFKAYQAAVSTYAQSCVDLSTPKGIVAHVSTDDTVQDWNSVREALGYEWFHFLSVSYGTFGASAYANKYPQHVGHFVLDGNYPHGISNLELADTQIKAVNRLLLRADAFCIFDPTCPFHTQGKGSVVKAFNTVLDRALSGGYANTSADDIRAVMTLGYVNSNPDFAALNKALDLAVNGNASALSYSVPTFTQNYASVLPIVCLDTHIDDNSFSGFDNIRKSIAKDDPARIGYSQDLTLLALCSGWPFHGNSDKPVPVQSSLLLVTSDFDLNTPTEASTIAWQQAPKSALVVRHSDDHGTFLLPGPARTAEIDFITSGNLPAPTNQALVTIYAPGGVRGPIQDPYTAPIGADASDMSKTG